jgi:hypothetical protein
MTNYRPIKLLMVFSKVVEKAVHSRLSQHLHTDNILVTEQCSFRKGISTEVAAFRLTDSVFRSVNLECMLDEFSVIWQRLLIDHEIFLAKLHNHGIQGRRLVHILFN